MVRRLCGWCAGGDENYQAGKRERCQIPSRTLSCGRKGSGVCMCDGRAFVARRTPQRMLSPQRTSL